MGKKGRRWGCGEGGEECCKLLRLGRYFCRAPEHDENQMVLCWYNFQCGSKFLECETAVRHTFLSCSQDLKTSSCALLFLLNGCVDLCVGLFNLSFLSC